MRASRLKLEGFAGIASGRGKTAIEINFDELPSDAKIVAIKGPNGAGKTTIMDNMHPYRVMPSRASAPTPSSFSFYDHLVDGADGLKELDWEHDDRSFRSVVRMKAAGKTKKQEAYLFEKKGDEFVPYQDQTGLTSDGKADTYDRSVETVLGKPEVFFTTQFSAQGKNPISTMTAGEIKTLMASMLAMENFKALADKAMDVVRGLKPHLSAFQALVVPLEQKVALLDPLLASTSTVRTEIDTMATQIESAKAYSKQKLTALSSIEARAGQQEQLRVQREAAVMQIASARQEHSKQLVAFQTRLSSETKQVDERFAQNTSSSRVAQGALSHAKQRIGEAQSLAARESEIAQAEASKRALQLSISQLRTRADDLFVNANKLTSLQAAVNDLRAAMATDLADGRALASVVDAAKATAALIGEVPCAGHAFSASCKLLEQANGANHSLPGDQQKLVSMRTSYSAKKKTSDVNVIELEKLVKADTDLKEAQTQITVHETQLNNAKAVLNDAPRIAQAKQELPQLREALAQTQSDFNAAVVVLDQSRTALDNLTAFQQDQTVSFKALQAKEVNRLEAALALLPDLIEGADVQLAKAAWERAELAVDHAETTREILRTQLRDAQTAASDVVDAKRQLVKLAASTDAISQEISQWTLLARALGNDGIIAMSIDDAGPSISALCNALLTDCYGGRFVVRLSTQEATATGVLKESFVIHVEDTLRGEQKELEMMSGGEKVWINECLVRAMALYIAQSSGAKFKTLFGDESDGPLDAERKRQFMAMKRAVLERGNYDREYLITQTPELWEMCDAVLDVTTL